jgi:nitrate reductase gamma subunit
MNFIISAVLALVVVNILAVIPFVGILGGGLDVVFGVVVPYLAVLIFIVGVIYRVVKWARSPVPFRIPTTGGQQQTFPWIKQNKLDNPSTTWGVVGRMALEILLFRSLFRNTRMELREGPKLSYASAKWLWLFAILFHYTFFTVLIRHLRFFTEPVPEFIHMIESLDGFMQAGILPFPGFMTPGMLLSGLILPLGATLLLLRRFLVPSVRYISLIQDYFPLFLIIGIAKTGILMRYFIKVDIIGVKNLMLSLLHFQPVVPEGIGVLFYIHLFLVSSLFAYFPFSKLMHMGGVFLSPTRNLPNNSRMVRHINPWNYPVKVHTYAEYEEEFREKMIEAGLPVEKE